MMGGYPQQAPTIAVAPGQGLVSVVGGDGWRFASNVSSNPPSNPSVAMSSTPTRGPLPEPEPVVLPELAEPEPTALSELPEREPASSVSTGEVATPPQATRSTAMDPMAMRRELFMPAHRAAGVPS